MANFTIKGNQISKMLKAIGAKNRAWDLAPNKDTIKGYRIAVLNNKLMVWGNDEDNMQTLDIDAPGVKFSIFIDATASRLFGLIGKNTIEVSFDAEAVKLHLVESLDSGTARMSIAVISKNYPVEPVTEDAGVDESDDVEPVITENTEAQPKTLSKKARETKFAPSVSAVDSDVPYHWSDAGPYTITTHDKVMTFRFSAHAEEQANYRAHTGELVSLDWDYTPLRVYDIVRVYENPTRWVVIDIVLNEYNLVNYVLRSEDGQTSPYYGFSIIRDFDKSLDNSCVTMIQCSHHKNTGESPAHPEEDIMNNQQIAEFEAQMQADKEYARKNGIKRMCSGWYYVANSTGEVFEIQRGDFAEYEGDNAKMWFVKVMNGEVIGDYVTLAEAKEAVKAMGADDAPTAEIEAPAPTDPTPSDELESSDALDKYESELCECGFTLIPEHKLDALDYLETRYDINYTKWTLGRYWTVTSVHGAPLPRYEEPALKPFGYNDIADVMDNRLKNLFTVTSDLFGSDGDVLATIPEVEEMLDRDMYDGWQLFIDDTRDGELRLYAERVTDDIEDTTPSRYSDWVSLDGGFCYMTIGRRA